ncbi:MAG: SDR family NAD(P)-dependent oxidoreductase [Desulfobacteraceae bacterium]|nr:MAG: SDR family NAD(P)-dependent oxidoreductase [Desulfobacteraceae bacterium]
MKGKRILVTGSGGFIGSHLTERLLREGADVRAMIHYNALGNRGWLENSESDDHIEFFNGDIRDTDSVRRAVKDRDIVFHLAALIAIPYSYEAPASYISTNIQGTLNILQAAREFSVERIVHTSTSEVYGTARSVPISEDHPLQGQSPYSASKIGADKMAEAYHLSFSVPVTTVRPFNAFGPRQSQRAVIPTIIAQCLFSKTIRLGSLSPTRDMNFVANIVDGFLLAAQSPEAIGRTMNIGSGREISIGDLAELIIRLTGSNIKIKRDRKRERPEKSEVERLLADSSLARNLIGWTPKVDLEEGLKRTINWIQEHPERYRPDIYAT